MATPSTPASFLLLFFAILFITSFSSRARRRSTVSKDEQTRPRHVEPLRDFRWDATQPLKLRTYKPRYFLTISAKEVSPSDYIQIDRDFFSRLDLRRDIIALEPKATIEATELAKPAVDEFYQFLVNEYLPHRFPGLFRIDKSKDILRNTENGWTYPLKPCPSVRSTLEALGKLVDEDFMFLLPSPDSDEYEVQAYVVCFASGFEVSRLLGRKMSEIHGEVPRFKEKLQLSMTRWFARLEVGRLFRRCNWTITTHGNLRNKLGENQLYDQGANDSTASGEINMEKACLRAELQHLHRLRGTKAIVFSYKTYLYSLSEVRAEGEGPALADAIDGFTKGNVPEIARYKRGTVWGRAVCEYLRS